MTLKTIVENNEEYIITDDTLNMVEKIKEFMNNQKKKNTGCLYCNNRKYDIENIYDLSEFYLSAIFCVEKHMENILYEKNIFYYLFFIENFIFEAVSKDDEISNVEKLLYEGKKSEKMKNKIIEKSKMYAVDSSVHINCEQEIDSLCYKVFKKMSFKEKMTVNENEVAFILYILFRRSEFMRFYKTFNGGKKSLVGYRLFLIFSMHPDSEKSITAIKNELKNAKRIKTDGFYMEESIMKELKPIEQNENMKINGICKNSVIEIIEKMNEDVGYENGWKDQEEWLEIKSVENKYLDCMKMWFFNKEKGPESVNASMIGVCITYRKFDDGWLIFNSLEQKYDSVIAKTCILCCVAIKVTHCNIWIDRLNLIIKLATEKNVRGLCCTTAKEIFSHLSDFTEEEKMKILEQFMQNVNLYIKESGDEFISTVLNGMSMLSHSSDDKLNVCCFEYANRIYTWWKTCKKGAKNFKKQKELKPTIYGSMLRVCEKTNNCDEFCSICKDLEKSSSDLNVEIFTQLDSYHRMKNCKCNLTDCDGRDKKEIKKLLKHVVKDKI
ncbi:hypothetical protein SLOPH_1727 [Spraguea lophii 42_110]|uniref:Uncharacterized protein n=1 Tax=Spraguea lophii (strain 42_110) TaxID=1358809 RepID=S7XLS2_SPRLO|nr:hypothetical protein SLOPH_1727 [Spraguea lophii 42_110]